MKLLIMMTMLVGLSGQAHAGAILGGQDILLTGAHAKEVRKVLNSLGSRTVKFLLGVEAIEFDGSNIRLLGTDLGELTGPDDDKLNRLGPAFGHDRAGNLYFRGGMAAYLVDVRGLKLFVCNNIQNGGAVGFPGMLTSACVIR